MSTSSLPVRWLQSLEWRRGFFAWARTDGVTWVYIFKVLAAAFITLWLAMRLELPQPRTAMITVFIVMQPQSGHVFAKSFYRVLGTLAGSAMMVALIAIFPQNTELFLPSLALWVGLCSAGAMRYRTFRAYGFVLAGYTAAMIGLPVLQHPDQAFMAAVWRVLEIALGILVSTFVSAAILPQSASAAMRNALYQRFGVFAGVVVEALRGDSQKDRFESSNVRFVAEAVGLESLRNVTAFEDPHMRRRSGRLVRMNSEFMAITTRFNALHRLLERLRARGPLQIVGAIEPGLNTLVELLQPYVGRALTDADALRLTLGWRPTRKACKPRCAACGPSTWRPSPASPTCSTSTPHSNCCTASSTRCTATPKPTPRWPRTSTNASSGTSPMWHRPAGWYRWPRVCALRRCCCCWAATGCSATGPVAP
ncbi:p-hydroxybenzoic acid efflux pump subunit AaeB [Pseudomonas sp. MM221]|nr:p-hydroxybenzoic acid efflux pump subunit AaeB [Pseudomonas sp. MM221]